MNAEDVCSPGSSEWFQRSLMPIALPSTSMGALSLQSRSPTTLMVVGTLKVSILKSWIPFYWISKTIEQLKRQSTRGEMFISSGLAAPGTVFLNFFQQDKSSGKPKALLV